MIARDEDRGPCIVYLHHLALLVVLIGPGGKHLEFLHRPSYGFFIVMTSRVKDNQHIRPSVPKVCVICPAVMLMSGRSPV